MSGARWLFATLVLWGAISQSYAGNWIQPNRRDELSLSERLGNDLFDGTLDEFRIFDAAVIAGGVNDPQQLDQLRRRFDSVSRSAAPEVKRHSDAKQRLDAVLACLHRDFLTGAYDADNSELHLTLVDGRFNCVTGTILFRCLCDTFQMECHAVASRDHVLCCQSGNPRLYIETTSRGCRAGDISQQPEAVRKCLELEESRDLTDVQLLGKIYYNVGVKYLRLGEFSKAVAQLQRAGELDADDRAAHENLLAALNNWALDQCDSEHYESARALIERVWELDREYPPMLTNDLHIHQRWVKSLCDEQRFSEAITILETARQRRPDVELFDRGQSAVYSLWAQSHFVVGESESGWKVLTQAFARTPASQDQLELAETTIRSACRELLEDNKSEQANGLVEQAFERLPSCERLLRQQGDW